MASSLAARHETPLPLAAASSPSSRAPSEAPLLPPSMPTPKPESRSADTPAATGTSTPTPTTTTTAATTTTSSTTAVIAGKTPSAEPKRSPKPAPDVPADVRALSPPAPPADSAPSPAHASATPAPKASSPTPEPTDSPDSSENVVIDMEIFGQILELDEDEDDFSSGMVSAYFSQAQKAFLDMDDAFKARDLAKLGSLGHFLKGSSAALGIRKVQESCEAIQYFGGRRDIAAGIDLSEDEALARIQKTLATVKVDYADAERWLRNYYVGKGGIPSAD